MPSIGERRASKATPAGMPAGRLGAKRSARASGVPVASPNGRPSPPRTRRALFLAAAIVAGVFALGSPIRIRAQNAPASTPKKPVSLTAEAWLRSRTDQSWRDWNAAVNEAREAAALPQRASRLRDALLTSIGGLPSANAPLHARVQQVHRLAGYRVEAVRYESLPGYIVTASLYIPDSASSGHRVPAVIIPCGHAQQAKAFDEYQKAAALLALNGIAALVYDPPDQGERMQRFGEDGEIVADGVAAHMQEGMAALLLGQSLSRYFAWDGIRGIDVLAARPEIDASRLGVTGHSGGGTLTCFLSALDPRFKAAAPCCYLSDGHDVWRGFGDAVDSEQYFFNELGIGFEHADFFLCTPPKPVLVLAATQDFNPIASTWETFRALKRTYASLGESRMADIVEDDVPHSYSRRHREAMVEWMLRWLCGIDRSVREPDISVLPEKDLFATPDGQVLHTAGARSIWDLLAEESSRLAGIRGHPDGEELKRRIRRVTGIPDQLQEAAVTESESRRSSAGDAIRTDVEIIPPDRPVPARLTLLTPTAASGGVPLLIVTARPVEALTDDIRKPLEAALHAGRLVAVCNPFGTGGAMDPDTLSEPGCLGMNAWLATYLLGVSPLGLRVEDVIRAMHCLIGQQPGSEKIEVLAEGVVAIPALHAAALQSGRISRLTLVRMPESWSDLFRLKRSFEMQDNYVHGVLRCYDLPDLLRSIEAPVELESPVTLLNLPVAGAAGGESNGRALDATRPGLIGVIYGGGDLRNPRSIALLRETAGTWRGMGASWSAEWKGYLLPPHAGPVDFEATCNREFELEIDGRIVLARSRFPGRASATVSMPEGRPVPISIRLFQSEGEEASFDLRWRRAGEPFQRITQSRVVSTLQMRNRAKNLIRR